MITFASFIVLVSSHYSSPQVYSDVKGHTTDSSQLDMICIKWAILTILHITIKVLSINNRAL